MGLVYYVCITLILIGEAIYTFEDGLFELTTLAACFAVIGVVQVVRIARHGSAWFVISL